jgi:hypothetical protein
LQKKHLKSKRNGHLTAETFVEETFEKAKETAALILKSRNI